MRAPLAMVALLPAVAGCLGSAPDAPRLWTVEWSSPALMAASRPKAPAVKLTLFDVRAPYSGTRLAVLRPGGSLAFDPFNSFAAQPAALFRGAAMDALSGSGAFEAVFPAASSVAAPLSAEVTVTRLALDCREKGRRAASVALAVTLVRSRAAVATLHGEASAPAGEGDYSAAFSRAFAEAMAAALATFEPEAR